MTRFLRNTLCWLLSLVITLQPNIVQAQQANITLQAGSGARMDRTVNGTPLLNITGPNGSGISHNKFKNFNVGKKGLVVNNATKDTVSRIGGAILKNSKLKGKAARLILNEVTSANRSHLEGFTEIAGQKADYILANPNGITCNGCGFINTSRSTLTTGVPVFDGTDLERLSVEDGKVVIGELGLNATDTDAFDIITRAAEISGAIHAKDLNIITGRNDVRYEDRKTTAKTDDGSEKPSLAIDSSALGGMYAGRIALLATEKGVGVNMQGDMAAATGDLTVTADGRIEFKKVAAKKDVTLTARNGHSVKNRGSVHSGRNLSVNSGTLETDQAILAAAGNVSLKTGDIQANNATIVAGREANGTQNPTGNLAIGAKGTVSLEGGRLQAVDRVDISAKNLKDGAGAQGIYGGDDVALQAEEDITLKGAVKSQTNLTAKARNLTLHDTVAHNDTTLSAREQATLTGHSLSGAQLSFEGHNLQSNHLTVGTGLKVTATQNAELNGVTRSNGGIELSANKLKTAELVALQDVNLTGTSALTTGDVYTKGSLSLTGGAVTTTHGTSEIAGQVSVTADSLDSANDIKALGDISVRTTGATRVRSGGGLQTKGALSLQAQSIETAGTLNAQQATELKATQAIRLNSTAVTQSSTQTTVNAGGDVTNAGRLTAAQKLDVQANNLVNGGILADGSSDGLRLNLDGDLTNNGLIQSVGNLTLSFAGDLKGTGGRFVAANDLNVTVGGVETENSLAQARGTATLRATDALNWNGTLSVGEDLDVSADSLNLQGRVNVAQDLTLLANQAATLGATSIVNGALDMRGGALRVADGDFSAGVNLQGTSYTGTGTLRSGGGIKITTSGALSQNKGQIVSAQQVGLKTTSGDIYTNATISGLSGATLDAAQALTVGPDGSVRSGTSDTPGVTSLTAGTTLTNKGLVAALGDVNVSARNIDNPGRVVAMQALDLSASQDVTSRGTFFGGESLSLNARHVNAADDLWESGGGVSLNVASLSLSNSILTSLTSTNLTASGHVTGTADLNMGRDLILSANSINLQGTLDVKRNVNLQASGGVTLAGDTTIDGTLTLTGTDLKIADMNVGGQTSLSGTSFSSTGTLETGSDLNITTSGGLNLGTKRLVSEGQLTLTSTGGAITSNATLSGKTGTRLEAQKSITVQSGGKVQSGANTTLKAGTGVNNKGFITAANTLNLNAGNVTNSGSMGADDLTVKLSSNLTNTGLLYARDDLTLKVPGTVLNNDGSLMADGDIHIDANGSGAKSNKVWNYSGTIESLNGGITIKTKNLLNERKGLVKTSKVVSSSGTRLHKKIRTYSGPSISGDSSFYSTSVVMGNDGVISYHVHDINKKHFNVTTKDTVTSSAPIPKIVSNNNMTIAAKNITNKSGQILTNSNLSLTGKTLVNTGHASSSTTVSKTIIPDIGHGLTSTDDDFFVVKENITSGVSRGTIERGYTKTSTSTVITNPGSTFITAGGNITGSFTGKIDNISIFGGANPKTIRAGNVNLARTAANLSGSEDATTQTAALSDSTDPSLQTTSDPNAAPALNVHATSPTIGLPKKADLNAVFKLPKGNGSLFVRTKTPKANYILEPNPVMRDMGALYGSDYFTERAGIDLDKEFIRLGNKDWETRSVRDQIMSATHKRFLQDHITSDSDQYKVLMDNALAQHKELQLSYGVALSAEQIGALTRDMVWMVETKLNDGRTAVRPVVYLARASRARIDSAGASIIAGGDLDLTAGGDLANTGTLKGKTVTLASENGSITNEYGKVQATGGALNMTAQADILNKGGVIVGKDVTLQAVDGSVRNQSQTWRPSQSTVDNFGGVHGETKVFEFNEITGPRAGIAALGGSLNITAGGDISDSGAGTFAASQDLSLDAGGNIDLASQTTRKRVYGEGMYEIDGVERTTEHTTALSSGGDMTLKSGARTLLQGTKAEAGGDLSIYSATDTILSAVQNRTQTNRGNWGFGTLWSKELNNDLAALKAAGDVSITSGVDTIINGAEVTAGENIDISSLANTTITSVQDSFEQDIRGKKYTLIVDKKDTVRSRLNAGGDLRVQSILGDVTLKAAALKAGGKVELAALNGNVNLQANKDVDFRHEVKTKTGGMWTTVTDQGRLDEKVQHTTIDAGDGLTIQVGTNGQVNVDYKDFGNLDKSVERLSKEPGLEWMADVKNGVTPTEWNAIQEAHKSWSKSATSMSPAAMMMVTMVLTAVTAGAGGLWGATTTVAGPGATQTINLSLGQAILGSSATASVSAGTAALTAGINALAVSASSQLIANKGDLGATLKQLGSSDSIRALAAAMASAGLTNGLTSAGYLPKGNFAQLNAADVVQKFAVQTTVRTAISAGIGGQDIGEALLNNVRKVGVQALMSGAQSAIGDLTDGAGDNDLPILNMLAHSVVGGLASEALGGDFKTGAASAFASSAAANSGVFDGMDERTLSAISQVIGGVSSLIAGGDWEDFQEGAMISQSAAFNNYLTHANINDMKAEIEACRAQGGGCSSAEEKAIGQKYAAISAKNDEVLAATCADVTCVNSYLSQAVGRFSQTASDLRDFSIDAFKALHRQDSFLISPEAADQINRNIAFKDDYEEYVQNTCGGVSSSACANEHYQKWEQVNDKIAIADKVKTVLSVAIGGGMTVGPKVVQTIKSCVSNPGCLSEVGITIVEAGAETIAGAPIAAPAGLTLAAGTLALQKGDEVVGLFEESVGYLGKIDGSDNAFWRAADGSLHQLDSAGELTAVPPLGIDIPASKVDEIISLGRTNRPDPSTYLSQTQIENHLSLFDEGASYLVPTSILDDFGRETLGFPDGSQFVMPKSQLDKILSEAGGDVRYIETKLGIPQGSWSGELSRIDISDTSSLNIRVPSGREQGANPYWLPGGKTSGGIIEAVVDNIPAGKYTETKVLE